MCEMPRERQVNNEDVMAAFDDIEGGFAMAAEIGEYFGYSRQWAHNRLVELHEEGRVRRKKSGGQSVIWWPTKD